MNEIYGEIAAAIVRRLKQYDIDITENPEQNKELSFCRLGDMSFTSTVQKGTGCKELTVSVDIICIARQTRQDANELALDVERAITMFNDQGYEELILDTWSIFSQIITFSETQCFQYSDPGNSEQLREGYANSSTYEFKVSQ